jgi:uracil-DNA glycosylase
MMNWNEFLESEKNKTYFPKLKERVETDRAKGIVYPVPERVFSAFEMTPFDQVKVVILGQDPYHGPGQAIGLSFAVPPKTRIPPSLRNVFKEIESDLGIECENNGYLYRWTSQGVFLLNTTLTVRAGEANSHENYGWDYFTDNAISALNEDDKPKVFLLWGNNAKKKIKIITNKNHLVLTAAHPSPLSASRGFFGCKHFSKTNDFLEDHGMKPIDWH